MDQQIEAIYDRGVLRLLEPLSLPDQTPVRLTIVTQPPAEAAVEPRDEWEESLLAIGVDCGVSLPDSAVSSEGLYE